MRLGIAFEFTKHNQRSLRYSRSRIASRRAAFASRAFLRSSASIRRLFAGALVSGVLHAGQRSAKPGLSGFNSNSSSQTLQIFMGKAIPFHDTTLATERSIAVGHDSLGASAVELRSTGQPRAAVPT
jgi:hypothetical protein